MASNGFTDLFGENRSREPEPPEDKKEAKARRARTVQACDDLQVILEDLAGGLEMAHEYLTDMTPKKSEKSVLQTRAELFAVLGTLESELKAAKRSVQETLIPMMEEREMTRIPVGKVGKVIEYQPYNDRKSVSKDLLVRAFGEEGARLWDELPVRSRIRLSLRTLDTI